MAGRIVIVKPETVLAWHRHGFRLFWTWKSRRRARSTGRSARRSPVNSQHGGGQPVVGCSANSRRTPEAGRRRQSGHGGQDTCPGTDDRPLRRGARFSRIMSGKSSPPISSSCRPPRVDSSSCWSSWPISDAASCTSRSRPIPRRHGLPNNSARRFPETRSLVISFAIVIPPSRESNPRRLGWGSMKCLPRHVHRGRTRMRSVSSAPFVVSASIT